MIYCAVCEKEWEMDYMSQCSVCKELYCPDCESWNEFYLCMDCAKERGDADKNPHNRCGDLPFEEGK